MKCERKSHKGLFVKFITELSILDQKNIKASCHVIIYKRPLNVQLKHCAFKVSYFIKTSSHTCGTAVKKALVKLGTQ